MNETANSLREKAAQCRRLAEGVVNRKDPVVVNLLALAIEFEARAVAFAAETTDRIPPNDKRAKP